MIMLAGFLAWLYSHEGALTLGVIFLNTNTARDDAKFHTQHDLHNTSHGTRGLSMADICLHSAYQKRVSIAVFQKHVCNAVQLNRVTDRGAGSVALKVGGIIGIKVSSKGVSFTDNGLLSNGAGLCNTAGLSVGVGSSAANNTSDRVAIADCVREPLQV